jgi:tRNA nucleotidyltransferase/poly(A) polymerase
VFGFELEKATRAALQAAAPRVTVVSPERIAQELRGMLGVVGQTRAARLLVETELAAVILPELPRLATLRASGGARTWWDCTLATLAELESSAASLFGLALAALLIDVGRGVAEGDAEAAAAGGKMARTAGRRWRLSNEEREEAAWLVEHQHRLRDGASRPWSQVQPLLAHRFGRDLVTLCAARAAALGESSADVEFCRRKLELPYEVLDPPPLVTGDDLKRIGMRPGREFSGLLQRVREAQLDGVVTMHDEALALVRRLRGQVAND